MKTALITGASSGIGEATALLLGESGYNLVLVARREERLKQLAEKLKSFEVEVSILICDVQNKSEVISLAEKNKNLLEKVTVLVNNAGLAKGLDPMQTANLDDWDAMIDTNIKGLLYWTRMLLPHLIKQPSAHIINIGSVAGRWTYTGGGVYCATKFAVRSLTEGLRMDLKGSSVRVTNIEPGAVETEFSSVRLNDADKAKEFYAGFNALTGKDIAECILWSLHRPQRVNIQEMVVFPTDQPAVGIIHKK